MTSAPSTASESTNRRTLFPINASFQTKLLTTGASISIITTCVVLGSHSTINLIGTASEKHWETPLVLSNKTAPILGSSLSGSSGQKPSVKITMSTWSSRPSSMTRSGPSTTRCFQPSKDAFIGSVRSVRPLLSYCLSDNANIKALPTLPHNCEAPNIRTPLSLPARPLSRDLFSTISAISARICSFLFFLISSFMSHRL